MRLAKISLNGSRNAPGSSFINNIMIIYFITSSLSLFGCAKAVNVTAACSRSYFSSKYINQMVVFGCFDFADKMRFFQKDILFSMRASYIPIAENLELKLILKVNYYKLGVVLDLDCPRSEIILDQFSDNKLPYNESYFWFLVSKSASPPTDLLRDLPLSIATEMTVALRRNDTYALYDAYNLSHRHGGRLNITYMGYWSSKDGLKNELTQYKYKRRQNFNKLALNFSVALQHPAEPDLYTYLSTPINRHLDTMIRFNYALTLHLLDTYNLTMNMLQASTWGYLVDGKFNGVLGQMVEGIVDIGVLPFQYKKERLDVCEYTVQTFVARPCFIFRHPKTNNVRNVFLMPFTEDVWWLIIIFAIIYWLLLLLTVRIELHYENYPKQCTLDTNPSSETALITTAAVCQQGLSDGPRIYSGRIVFLSLFLWGLLMFQFYSASVVGSLLSETPRFINDLKDLSDSALEVGIEDIGYNYDYFATTSDQVAIELHERKVGVNKKRDKEPYLPPTDGLRKVQQGGYAFHVDVATAYKIITDTYSEDEICDLVEIQLFPPKPVSTATSRHSPFKKMVTYAMRQMVEHGLTVRQRHVWEESRPECPKSHSARPVPVAIEEFSPALFSLCMGIATALFVMFIETYIEHRKRRQDPDNCFNGNHKDASTLQTTLDEGDIS